MSIRDRWIDAIHRAATGTRKARTLLTPIGLIIFGLFTGVFVALSMLTDRWLSLPWPLPGGPSWVIAVLFVAVGAGAAAWSALYFLKVKGSPVPFNPPPELVTTGPYRFVRNPMVTGVFFLLFGIGFAIQSLSLVVFYVPVYILANIWEIKKIEEPELIMRLGEDYDAYRRRTPMFIPGKKWPKRSE
ncbi:MAG: isoprenylcysteine carboxylmethyltransferase family protein [Desulfobacteraceae bacterium]|jgi:protein-S-isoprenylcysteine O-methyltransferase Ste14|nr:isoprenylcysteine carboxylmethyltransferase family protein [Desulfobacteraceae bacterium]